MVVVVLHCTACFLLLIIVFFGLLQRTRHESVNYAELDLARGDRVPVMNAAAPIARDNPSSATVPTQRSLAGSVSSVV